MLGKLSKTKRRRKHGFLKMMKKHAKVVLSRRSKGRKRLATSVHSKS